AEPGFKSVAPGNGVIIKPPVSVCHQVSMTGQRLSPTTVYYQFQASGLIGSPTEPIILRLLRSLTRTKASPSRIMARMAVGAVYRMVTLCLSTICPVRAQLGYCGTPSNITVVVPFESGPYST